MTDAQPTPPGPPRLGDIRYWLLAVVAALVIWAYGTTDPALLPADDDGTVCTEDQDAPNRGPWSVR